MTSQPSPLRVVQWATGTIGRRSLQAVIDHPDMQLVGVHVHSADKVGKDAGALCDKPDTGVIASSDIETILSLRPDCILYMPQNTDFDEIARLLEAGCNIVTTKGDFQNPECMNADERQKIDAACDKGKSSIYSTGSSPGFITDTLPMALMTLQRHVRCFSVDEFSNVSSRNSPQIVFGAMGFGNAPNEALLERLASSLQRSRERSFRLLADTYGLHIDDVVASTEVALAKHTIQIAAGTIPQGTVAGTRITVEGRSAGVAVFRFRAIWYCTTELDTEWDLIYSGWRIHVEGDTPLDVTITFPVSLEEYPHMSPGLTAHPAVNAVPAVCAAAPGIRTSLEMPSVPSRLETSRT